MYLAISARTFKLRLWTWENSAEIISSVWLEKVSSAKLIAVFWEGERSRVERFFSVEVLVS